jgi:hypothetical protein
MAEPNIPQSTIDAIRAKLNEWDVDEVAIVPQGSTTPVLIVSADS